MDSRETGGMWRVWYRWHETIVRQVAYDGCRGTGVRQVWDRCQTDGVRQELDRWPVTGVILMTWNMHETSWDSPETGGLGQG